MRSLPGCIVAETAGCASWSIFRRSVQRFAAENATNARNLTFLSPLDRLGDQALRLRAIAPADHLHPFAGLEILVVLEEMLDLLQRDLRHVGVVHHVLIALG